MGRRDHERNALCFNLDHAAVQADVLLPRVMPRDDVPELVAERLRSLAGSMSSRTKTSMVSYRTIAFAPLSASASGA